MKIGIIGAGNIGGTLTELFARAGDDVAVSNSRDPSTLAELVGKAGPHARAMTAGGAAAFGDVVVLAIPLLRYDSLPADELKGKIVVDATNYYPQRDGQIDFGGLSTSEWIGRKLPGARMVKAFNTIYYGHLATQGNTNLPMDQRRALFVAGDDAEAKRTVSQLISDIGFAAIDTGSLHAGGLRQQPDTDIYGKELTAQQARAVLEQAP
jgi:8-hydroxy-5-deazaflavin:NADPH oxidoreductase